jgi:branched-subunit amino acid ABC-type transport system permease component
MRLLASLGVLILLQNSVSLAFGDQTKVLINSQTTEGLPIAGGFLTFTQVIGVVVTCLVIAFTWLLLRFSRFGKMLRAVASDPELARISGVPYRLMALLSLFVASALAAIAALISASDIGLTPQMGFAPVLMGMVVAVAGGMASVPGAITAGLLIGLTENVAVAVFQSQWQSALVFLILILFLIFKPNGLFPKQGQKAGT